MTIKKEAATLALPAGLFLYVLKELKEKSFDSIEETRWKEIIANIFGFKYVYNNWESEKHFLLENVLIEEFFRNDESLRFIKITSKGERIIQNGVPDEWCASAIQSVIERLEKG